MADVPILPSQFDPSSQQVESGQMTSEFQMSKTFGIIILCGSFLLAAGAMVLLALDKIKMDQLLVILGMIVGPTGIAGWVVAKYTESRGKLKSNVARTAGEVRVAELNANRPLVVAPVQVATMQPTEQPEAGNIPPKILPLLLVGFLLLAGCGHGGVDPRAKAAIDFASEVHAVASTAVCEDGSKPFLEEVLSSWEHTIRVLRESLTRSEQ